MGNILVSEQHNKIKMVRFVTSVVSVAAILSAVPQSFAFSPPLPATISSSTRVANYNSLPKLTVLEASRASRSAAVPQVFEEDDNKDPEFVQTITDLWILALRVGTCSLMIHHGFDKVQNVEGFSANVVAKFFGFLPGPPQFWTLSAAGTQIAGAGLLSVGILSRPVAFSMMCTMVVAVVFHLLNSGVEGFPLAVVKAHSYNYELAAMYVIVLAYFSANGAGAFSVDQAVLGGELNLYGSLWNSVTGGNKDDEE